jgi:hypothetical protein
MYALWGPEWTRPPRVPFSTASKYRHNGGMGFAHHPGAGFTGSTMGSGVRALWGPRWARLPLAQWRGTSSRAANWRRVGSRDRGCYLPREVFFGRLGFAGAFFTIWASDFGRFLPATSDSFPMDVLPGAPYRASPACAAGRFRLATVYAMAVHADLLVTVECAVQALIGLRVGHPPDRARTARVSAEVEAEGAISFLLSSFLLFYPPQLMRAVSASSLVNGVRNDHPRLLEPGATAAVA